MAVRRVVTGHTPDGASVVVSDEEVPPIPIGDAGTATTLVWYREEPGRFPDDGSPPQISAIFPPPGGCNVAVMELAPGDGGSHGFHEFVSTALQAWADPDEPGMHRTATMDYDVVLAGTIGLELDNGAEVTLAPGDIVVQNGTRHRWHNRGDTIARLLSVTVGAYNAIEGGRPV
jgi:mannose-6-phosphate isomerase-like protein (cupin superfamily)